MKMATKREETGGGNEGFECRAAGIRLFAGCRLLAGFLLPYCFYTPKPLIPDANSTKPLKNHNVTHIPQQRFMPWTAVGIVPLAPGALASSNTAIALLHHRTATADGADGVHRGAINCSRRHIGHLLKLPQHILAGMRPARARSEGFPCCIGQGWMARNRTPRGAWRSGFRCVDSILQ